MKGKWTDAEDNYLRMAVARCYSKIHWSRVAEEVPGRSSKQCRERWNNFLRPDINRAPFSPEEDGLLIRLCQQYHYSWAAVAKNLPGRTENNVKSRYEQLAKQFKKGKRCNSYLLSIRFLKNYRHFMVRTS